MAQSSEDYLISIDLGTSSIRVALIGFDLKVRFQEQIPTILQMDGTGMAVQDADEIIRLGLTGLSAGLDWAEANQVSTQGICFSNTSASLVCLDRDFQPLAPALTYLDLRSRAQADRLLEIYGSEKFRFTGAPIHASYWLPKFIWLAENGPIFKASAHFCSIKDLFVYRLTGQFVTDVANAGADGICDVRTQDWDPEMLTLAGVRVDQLPKVEPITTLMDLNPSVDDPQIKRHSGLKVVLGAMDGLLASLGAGAFKLGQVTTTIGSSGACRVAARTPLTEGTPLKTWSYPLAKDLWIRGGAMNSGGLVTSWLVENFSESGNSDGVSYEEFFLSAASVSPGADGLLFLPYLFGERAPIYDENARGVFFGLNAQHRRAHFARAGLEGILFALYAIFELVSMPGETPTIRATGGYLKSDLMLQIQADIFGCPIATPENLESSVIGAAMLGMKALGVIDEYEDIAGLLPVTKTYYPDTDRHQVYQQIFARFTALYGSLKTLF